MSFTLIMYLLAIHSAEFFKKMDNLYFEIFGRTHKILNIVNYENQQRLLQIEVTNNEFTKEMLEISMQRMKLGQTNTLEVHQAQENYVQSCTRLINIKFNMKIAEIKLKQLLAEL